MACRDVAPGEGRHLRPAGAEEAAAALPAYMAGLAGLGLGARSGVQPIARRPANAFAGTFLGCRARLWGMSGRDS